ncbi:hypothetical protein MKW94_025670, partial [Papaver nudicaule]|nr:hypothetical protein [Papaver nudicaule]
AIAERSVSHPDVVNDMMKQWGVYGQILVIVFCCVSWALITTCKWSSLSHLLRPYSFNQFVFCFRFF